MGCVLSAVDRPPTNSRLFDVYNIDDRGQERNAGQMEIGDDELVLHQTDKDLVRWPLKSLRRYGFDAELFSFESGRRCATGPGIYAFRCSRAETLFNVLQESIIRAGQMEVSRGGRLTPEPMIIDSPAPPSDWFPLQNFSSSNHVTTTLEMTSAAKDYVNQSTQDRRHDYVNQSSDRKPSDAYIKYAELKHLGPEDDDDGGGEPEVFTSSSLFPSGPSAQSRCAYVNLPRSLEGENGRSEVTARGHQYMNIGSSPACRVEASAALTYAQLDLLPGQSTVHDQDQKRPSLIGTSSIAEIESFRSKPEVYAAIDFRRTRALSFKVDEELNEGYRKTRHNSTIETKSSAIN